MRYIYQFPDWPNLHWDEAEVSRLLAEVRFHQGALMGRMTGMGTEIQVTANIEAQSSEVVASSAIEGEHLEMADVRSSIAEGLGKPLAETKVVGDEVSGFADLMRDVTMNFHQPLTKNRLYRWHRLLFRGDRDFVVGKWRGPDSGAMRVVSGEIGGESKVHFEAPAAEKVAGEMERFLEWLATDSLDPILAAAVAHLRFLTVHPFEDGNGRIARAISEHLLAKADGSSQRFYSLSTQIQKERSDYYFELESAQRGDLDITDWIEWFLGCFDRALAAANSIFDVSLRKDGIRKRLEQARANPRQSKVVEKMMDGFQGNLTSSKYAKIAKCSQDTAIRDIRNLMELGILVASDAGGRSRSYRLVGVE